MVSAYIASSQIHPVLLLGKSHLNVTQLLEPPVSFSLDISCGRESYFVATSAQLKVELKLNQLSAAPHTFMQFAGIAGRTIGKEHRV